MPKKKLSETIVRNLKFDSKPQDYYDAGTDTPLILRVGKKSKTFYAYIASKKDGLRVGMYKLGRFGERGEGLSLDMARQECRNFIGAPAKASAGFHHVTLRGYLEHQYKTDRNTLEKPVSQKTIDSIKRYFAHALDTRCCNLKDADYAVFKANFGSLSESSCRKAYYMFNAVFTTLIAHERIYQNPLAKRKFKNSLTKPINIYDFKRNDLYKEMFSSEFGKRTKFSKGFSLETKLIVAIVIDTGARPSEVRLNYFRNFRIEKNNATMIIPAEITKTSKPREVPIFSKILIDILQDYLNTNNTKRNSDRMFINKDTKDVYSQGAYRKVWQELQRSFSLNGRFYDLRHTFATDVYQVSGDIKLVADLLGDTVATADKYYTRSSINKARDILKDMNE